MYNLTKNQIINLSKTSQAAEDLLKNYLPEILISDEAVDLSYLKNIELSIPSDKGMSIVLKHNDNLYHLYTNKSLLVGEGYRAKIVNSINQQLIIFEKVLE